MNLYELAHWVRHAPGISRADGLWNPARRAFRRFLRTGVSVRVGGHAKVRIPAEFCGGGWTSHEPAAILAVCNWLDRHPHGMLIDIGCSLGIFSASALFRSATCRVVSIDSDLKSVHATQRMCRFAPKRLDVVHGFVADSPVMGSALDEAVRRTAEALRIAAISGNCGATR